MPNLTVSQLQTLKTAILAETNPTFVTYRQEGSTGLMSQWFNLLSNPAHLVWNTKVPVSFLLDTIQFDRYTPNSAADGTALFTNRMLAIQTKQMNLQNMLIGREFLDTSKSRVRDGLLDAVINLPSGTNGALLSAAGTNGVRLTAAMTRVATNGEKVFATISATTGDTTAFLLTYEGFISDQDVLLALGV